MQGGIRDAASPFAERLRPWATQHTRLPILLPEVQNRLLKIMACGLIVLVDRSADRQGWVHRQGGPQEQVRTGQQGRHAPLVLIDYSALRNEEGALVCRVVDD